MTIEATIINANRSHWLALERAYQPGEPFSKEELHPILELSGVPRLGRPVRAEFSADRYVSSSYDEKTGESSPRWGAWRIVLRDVREVPGDGEHAGQVAAGVGDTTRRLIRAAGEPVILEWLESDAYRESRQRTAAHAVVRELEAPAEYRINQARRELDDARDHLHPTAAWLIGQALEKLTEARDLVDAATAEQHDSSGAR